MIIRESTAQDWEQIYPFFSEIVAAGTSYAYPEGLSSEKARELWMGHGCTVVAMDGEVVLGSATMGSNRPGRGSHLATGSFMVDARHAGRGVGRALGGHLIDWARSEGYRGIQFNAVVESNVAAVKLWTSLGFKIIGTVPEAYRHAEEGYVGLHVMYLPLASQTD